MEAKTKGQIGAAFWAAIAVIVLLSAMFAAFE
jgi:hypothetical protein